MGICGYFRDLNVTLKLKLQISNLSHTNITHRNYVEYSLRLSGLLFPSYRAKYMENVEKGSLGWMFMVLIHRLNFY